MTQGSTAQVRAPLRVYSLRGLGARQAICGALGAEPSWDWKPRLKPWLRKNSRLSEYG
jgi:hypothetical protein